LPYGGRKAEILSLTMRRKGKRKGRPSSFYRPDPGKKEKERGRFYIPIKRLGGEGERRERPAILVGQKQGGERELLSSSTISSW